MNISELTKAIKADKDKPTENETDFAIEKAIDYVISELDKRVVQGVSYETVIAELKSELYLTKE